MVASNSGSAEDGSPMLGKYELLLRLYDSELGVVWAAREAGGEEDAKIYAVREIDLSPPVGLETGDALVEAWEWTADARHERLAASPDVVMEEGRLGVVSEYAEADPLTTLFRLASVRRVVLPVPVALHIALDVLDGMAFLHRRADELGVAPEQVFGGISPGNLLVGSDGRALILEPGLSAAAGSEKAWSQNPKRAAYSAPERIDPQLGELSAATDVFAVGVLLWEMLQNKRLFGGLSYAAVSKKVTTGSIDRVDASTPAGGEPIPSEVADVVAKALERDPAARYAAMADMAEAIRATGLATSTPEEVAAVVEKLAGKALASRRGSIERALRGEAPDQATAMARAKASLKPPAGRQPPRKPAPPPPPRRPPGKGGKAGRPPLPPKRGGAAAAPAGTPAKPPVPPARDEFVSVVDETTAEVDEKELAKLQEADQAEGAPPPAEEGSSPGRETVGTEFDVPVSESEGMPTADEAPPADAAPPADEATPAEAAPPADDTGYDADDDEDDDEDDEYDRATQVMGPEDNGLAAAIAEASQKAEEKKAAADEEPGEKPKPLAIPRPGASSPGPGSSRPEAPASDEDVPTEEDEAPAAEEDPDEVATTMMTSEEVAKMAARASGGEEDEPGTEEEAESPEPGEAAAEEEQDEAPAADASGPAAAAAAEAAAEDADLASSAQAARTKRLKYGVGGIVAVLLLIIIIVASSGPDETEETEALTGATTAEPAPATTTTETATETEEEVADAGEEEADAGEEEDAGEEDAGEEDAGEEEPAEKPKRPRGPRKPRQPRKPRFVPGDL